MGVRAEGVRAISAGVEHGTRATDFAMHSYTNPVICIDGDSADACWLLFVASRRHQGPANMVFINDAIGDVRTGDGWRIRTVERRLGWDWSKAGYRIATDKTALARYHHGPLAAWANGGGTTDPEAAVPDRFLALQLRPLVHARSIDYDALPVACCVGPEELMACC